MLIPTKYKKSISFLPSFFCVFICSFTCSHVQFECSAVVFWAPPTSSTIGGCRTRGVTRGPWFACLLLWLVSLNVGVNREENDISKQTELNELNIQLIQLLYIRKFYTKYQPGVNSFFKKITVTFALSSMTLLLIVVVVIVLVVVYIYDLKLPIGVRMDLCHDRLATWCTQPLVLLQLV